MKHISNRKRIPPKFYILESKSEPKETKEINPLQIVGTLAGLTGILGALFWFLGRAYYSGITAHAGVSTSTIIPTNEEYIGSGAIRFIIMAFDILFLAVAYFASSIIAHNIATNINKIKNDTLKSFTYISILIVLYGIAFKIFSVEKILSVTSILKYLPNVIALVLLAIGLEISLFFLRNPSKDPSGSKNALSNVNTFLKPFTATAEILLFFMVFIILLINNVMTATRAGFENSCQAVYNKSIQMVLYSNKPLPLTGNKGNDNIYKYDGYYLLFIDKTNYNQYFTKGLEHG